MIYGIQEGKKAKKGQKLEPGGRCRIFSVTQNSECSPGRAEYNLAPDLATALATPKKTNFPFLTAEELPHFLSDLAGYPGSIITKTATQIIMLTGVRTQELRFARWELSILNSASGRYQLK